MDQLNSYLDNIKQLFEDHPSCTELQHLKSENHQLQQQLEQQSLKLQRYKARVLKYEAWIRSIQHLLPSEYVSPSISTHNSQPTVPDEDIICISDADDSHLNCPGDTDLVRQQKQDAEAVLTAWEVPTQKKREMIGKIKGPERESFDFWVIRGPNGEEL
ncbi:hypothetical protein GEMRC1_002096 [Eukaryota sp. GEM-RC1]